MMYINRFENEIGFTISVNGIDYNVCVDTNDDVKEGFVEEGNAFIVKARQNKAEMLRSFIAMFLRKIYTDLDLFRRVKEEDINFNVIAGNIIPMFTMYIGTIPNTKIPSCFFMGGVEFDVDFIDPKADEYYLEDSKLDGIIHYSKARVYIRKDDNSTSTQECSFWHEYTHALFVASCQGNMNNEYLVDITSQYLKSFFFNFIEAVATK